MSAAWTGFLLSLSLCLDLGLVNVTILRTALDRGGKAAFLLGVGSSVGDLAYFSVAVAGAATFWNWAPLRWLVWIAGTATLLCLAWRMARAAISPKLLEIGAMPVAPGGSAIGLLTTGAGLALASPSAILWFAAVGGSVIASFGGDRRVLWPFGAGFFVAGLAWSALFAGGAAVLKRVTGPNGVRTLSVISALLFIYFALTVFLRGLRQMFG